MDLYSAKVSEENQTIYNKCMHAAYLQWDRFELPYYIVSSVTLSHRRSSVIGDRCSIIYTQASFIKYPLAQNDESYPAETVSVVSSLRNQCV